MIKIKAMGGQCTELLGDVTLHLRKSLGETRACSSGMIMHLLRNWVEQVPHCRRLRWHNSLPPLTVYPCRKWFPVLRFTVYKLHQRINRESRMESGLNMEKYVICCICHWSNCTYSSLVSVTGLSVTQMACFFGGKNHTL